MIGHLLGHYLILEKIGAGGMGEVYSALDAQLDRRVALKVLPSSSHADESARRRFRKEALMLAKLNHPNIEMVFEFNTQEGVDFLVMELIDGQPLDQKLKQGALLEREVPRLGAQLAEGLAAAHEQKVIHRDLKPANLIITGNGQLKILDFGLATLMGPSGDLTTTASTTEKHGVPGTLPYMAPEQLRGERTDCRTDIYAVGAVLYEMATGCRPFPEKDTARLISAILHESPIPPRMHDHRIKPVLERVILKALDKDPERRYQSARELQVDLQRLNATPAAPVLASPKVATRTAFNLTSNTRHLKVSVAISLGFVAAITFLMMRGRTQPSEDVPKVTGSNTNTVEPNPPRPSLTSAPTQVTQLGPSESGDTNGINAMLARWAGSLGRRDLDQHMVCYAPLLERYFKATNVSRETIRADKERALQRYSTLEMSVSDVQIKSQTGDRAQVDVRKKWDFEGDAAKPFIGQALEEMIVNRALTGWEIVSEQELRVFD